MYENWIRERCALKSISVPSTTAEDQLEAVDHSSLNSRKQHLSILGCAAAKREALFCQAAFLSLGKAVALWANFRPSLRVIHRLIESFKDGFGHAAYGA